MNIRMTLSRGVVCLLLWLQNALASHYLTIRYGLGTGRTGARCVRQSLARCWYSAVALAAMLACILARITIAFMSLAETKATVCASRALKKADSLQRDVCTNTNQKTSGLSE